MLEVLYFTVTKKVKAWCADPDQFGNFKPKPKEAIVILPINPPDYDSDQFYVDLGNQTIYGEPIPPDSDYVRACELLANPPTAISQPEMWELMRIFGRKLGYH